MRKPALMDPDFPDLIKVMAIEEQIETRATFCCVNDNDLGPDDELSDPLLMHIARLEIEATRCW